MEITEKMENLCLSFLIYKKFKKNLRIILKDNSFCFIMLI